MNIPWYERFRLWVIKQIEWALDSAKRDSSVTSDEYRSMVNHYRKVKEESDLQAAKRLLRRNTK